VKLDLLAFQLGCICLHFACCLFNAMHSNGQILKSPERPCMHVFVHVFIQLSTEAPYLHNGAR